MKNWSNGWKGVWERGRGVQGEKGCPPVCVYSVIAAGSAQYSRELFKDVWGRPRGSDLQQDSPQNDNSNDVNARAGEACFVFWAMKWTSKRGNDVQSPKMNSELIAEIRILIELLMYAGCGQGWLCSALVPRIANPLLTSSSWMQCSNKQYTIIQSVMNMFMHGLFKESNAFIILNHWGLHCKYESSAITLVLTPVNVIRRYVNIFVPAFWSTSSLF